MITSVFVFTMIFTNKANSVFPQMIYTSIVSYASYPGRQLRSKSKPRELIINFQKYILTKIFPVNIPLNHSEYDLQNQSFILPDQDFVCLGLTGNYSFYQHFISNRIGRSYDLHKQFDNERPKKLH